MYLSVFLGGKKKIGLWEQVGTGKNLSWTGKNLSGTGKNLSEMGPREIDPDIFVIWAARKSARRKGHGERVGQKTSENQICDEILFKKQWYLITEINHDHMWGLEVENRRRMQKAG